VGRTRRLTKILSRAMSNFKVVDGEVDSTVKENTESFKEINEKIDNSIANAHNELIRATNQLIQSGGKDTAQLTAVCEGISSLAELTTLVMPIPATIPRPQEAGQAEEGGDDDDNEGSAISDMMFSLTDGGVSQEPKSVAQVKMERMSRRLSKRLSTSLALGVRRSGELSLERAMEVHGGKAAEPSKGQSYVKSQVQEIETSLQQFEKTLQEKVVQPGSKRLTRKLTRFVDIIEEIEKDGSDQQPDDQQEVVADQQEVVANQQEALAGEKTADAAKRTLWDEMGAVRTEMVGKNEVVKAGTLDQLILHLTSVSSDTMSGTDFFETFMITLQTFTTAEVFVEKMIERYRVPPCPPGKNEKRYHEEFKMPIQIRVSSVL